MSNKTQSIELLNNLTKEFIENCKLLPVDSVGTIMMGLARLDQAIKGTADFPEAGGQGNEPFNMRHLNLGIEALAFIDSNMQTGTTHNLLDLYEVKDHEAQDTEMPKVNIYSESQTDWIGRGTVYCIYRLTGGVMVNIMEDGEAQDRTAYTKWVDHLDTDALCQIADQIQRIIADTKPVVIDEWSSWDVSDEVYIQMLDSYINNDLQVVRLLAQSLTEEQFKQAINWYDDARLTGNLKHEDGTILAFIALMNDYRSGYQAWLKRQ